VAKTVFWCLRADSTISWNWAVVCIPLWIVDGIYYCCLGCMYASSDSGMDPEDKSHEKPPLYKLYAFLKALLLLVLQVFLALKLNGDLSWTLIEVLIPYFVDDGLNLLEGLAGGLLGYNMLTKNSEGAGVSHTEDIKKQRSTLVVAVARKLVLNLARIAQGVLLGLKVDGSLGDASWWLVFIPVWLYVAFFISFPVRKYLRAKTQAKAPKPDSPTQHTHDAYTRESVAEDEEEAVSKFPALDALCTILVVCALMSPFFILSARLQDGSFSSIYVLLPWLIVVRMTALLTAGWCVSANCVYRLVSCRLGSSFALFAARSLASASTTQRRTRPSRLRRRAPGTRRRLRKVRLRVQITFLWTWIEERGWHGKRKWQATRATARVHWRGPAGSLPISTLLMDRFCAVCCFAAVAAVV
jgi:hypothetical protein